jgi:sugar (pentulose or hexulose) kinase
LWCRILADVTGRKICIPENTEASALGAAIAAAVAVDWYGTFRQAATEMTAIKKEIKPDRQNHKRYERLFASYKTMYPALKEAGIDRQG